MTNEIVGETETTDTSNLDSNIEFSFEFGFGTVTEALAYCGSEAVLSLRQSFNQFIQLDPSSSSVRSFYLDEVIEAMGQIGSDAADAVPELTVALAQNDRRCAAADALRAIGMPLTIPYSQLADYFAAYEDSQSYPEVNCRIAIAELIGLAGKPEIAEAELLRILNEDEIDVRSRIDAAEAISRLGDPVLAKNQLISILENPSTIVDGEQAFLALSRLNTDLSQLTPDVLRILQSGSSNEGRTSAALALVRFDIASDEAIAALTQVIASEQNSSVLTGAALALTAASGDPQTIVAALSDSVQNLESDQTNWGYYGRNSLLEMQLIILQSLGDDAALLVPPLIEVLSTSQDWWVRFSVLKLLGAMGSYAEPAVEVLLTVLNDELHDETDIEEYELRIDTEIIETLGLIGAHSDAAVNTMVQIIQDQQNKDLVFAAVRALGGIGSRAERATDVLLHLLDDEDERLWLRAEVVKTLGLVSSDSDKVVATLLEILVLEMLDSGDLNDNRDSWESKQLAVTTAEALSYLGKTDVAVLALLELIENNADQISALEPGDNIGLNYTISDEFLDSVSAGDVLGIIGRPALEPMLMALNNTNVQRQRAAAYGVARVSPLPDDALDSLLGVLQDETRDLEVRRFVAYALDTSGKDVDWFFQQENLVKPEQALCPAYPDFFDPYTGQCLVVPKNGPGDIFNWIKGRVGG